MYRDGWYYLLGTHGTCCDGANSTYNIRVGRSRKVTGPYLDNMGMDMLKGGGKLVAAASGRFVGLGHFGLLDLGDGVQKFSCHYEADLDRGGRSVLDIRPLLWKDGWPVGGDNFQEGTYEIQSERSGYALELAVDFVRMGGGRRPRRLSRWSGAPADSGAPVTADSGLRNSPRCQRTGRPATSTFASATTCSGPIRSGRSRPSPTPAAIPARPISRSPSPARIARWLQPQTAKLWRFPPLPASPEQLWRIDQLTDGTYRIMPKAVPNSKEPLALTAVGGSTPTLAKFDPKSDKARWNFKTP